MTRTSPPLDASNTCTELPQAPSRYSNSHFDKKRKKCKLLTWIFKKELQLQRWEREAPGKPEAELLYQVLFFLKKYKYKYDSFEFGNFQTGKHVLPDLLLHDHEHRLWRVRYENVGQFLCFPYDNTVLVQEVAFFGESQYVRVSKSSYVTKKK